MAKILHRDIFWFFLRDEEFVSRTITDGIVDLDKFPASKVCQLAKRMESSKATVWHIKQVSGDCAMPWLKLTLICFAKIEIHINTFKSIKSSSTNQGSGYKLGWVIDKLSQHAITQSQTAETKHAIPTCYLQTSYPSMQLANWKSGKP